MIMQSDDNKRNSRSDTNGNELQLKIDGICK